MIWLAIWLGTSATLAILWAAARAYRRPDCFGDYDPGNAYDERECQHCGYLEDCVKETYDETDIR